MPFTILAIADHAATATVLGEDPAVEQVFAAEDANPAVPAPAADVPAGASAEPRAPARGAQARRGPHARLAPIAPLRIDAPCCGADEITSEPHCDSERHGRIAALLHGAAIAMRRTPLRRRTALHRRGEPLRRRAPLERAPLVPASPTQRDRVRGTPCIVCGAGTRVDPAHLVPRALGGCDDALCVVPLCRAHHRAYDRGRLDLVPHLEPDHRAEAAHAVKHLGLVGALRRLSGRRDTAEAA